MIKIKLMTPRDLEYQVRDPRVLQEEDLIPLCTVVEPIIVADSVLKQRTRLDWRTFLDGWRVLTDTGGLYVAPLSADCLNHALFERSDGYVVTGLWSGVQGTDQPPDHTVRRLVLRPSDQTWWDGDLYEEMESWYNEA